MCEQHFSRWVSTINCKNSRYKIKTEPAKKRALLFVLSISTITFLSGCIGPVKVDAYQFQIVDLEKAEFLPGKEKITQDKPRVGIARLELYRDSLNLNDTNSRRLESVMRGELEGILTDAQKVQLIDKALAERIQKSLIEYEKVGGRTPKPFEQVDYLVFGSIDSATIDKEYDEPYKNKKGEIVPGVCTIRGKFDGILKVYDILENRIQATKKVSGSAFIKDQSSRCPKNISSNTHKNIFLEASKSAIGGSWGFFSSLFAPVGYITEKRTDGDTWVFKVSTSGETMSDYSGVTIYERRDVLNPLNGKTESETLSIAKAKIANQVGSNFVWIHIKDKKIADRIKLGHVVKANTSRTKNMLKNLKIPGV